MKVHETATRRLAAIALVFSTVAAGCGDGGGLPPAAAPAPAPAPVAFGAFPSAVAVIGQEGFDQVAPDGTPGTLSIRRGEPAVTAGGGLFVADSGTGTLKVFSRHDQPGSFTDYPGVTRARSVSMQSGRLVVVDGDTVRIFESAAPGAPQIAFAGGATGCSTSGLNNPTSAFLTPNGRLVVADSSNHRVLIWNTVGSGALGEAHVVVGQRTMTSCVANNDNGDTDPDPAPTASTLSGPRSVWSDGTRLVVADTGNNRVLVWDNLPAGHYQPATTVIGQRSLSEGRPHAGDPTPSSMSLATPVSVDVNDAGQLAVADEQNNRVLVWNRIPATHGQPADQVLGKAGFTDGESSAPSASTLSEPEGARFHGRDLVVVDTGNNRVMVWRGTAPPVVTPPSVHPAPSLPPTEPLIPPGPGVGAY
ncbi:hypothetical protein [Ramlibacter henchirensis]|nr:hypothetical protein [Ramlibacter henchirensis]